MTDPGVAPKKGFLSRLRDFFSGGSEREEGGPTQAEQVAGLEVGHLKDHYRQRVA